MSTFILPIQKMDPITTLEEKNKAGNPSNPGVPFANVFKDAFNNMKETQAVSDQEGYQLAMGNVDNLSGLMIDLQKAEVARTMAVQLTTRAVSSYKEIMQMQI